MNYYGIDVQINNMPVLDTAFIPFAAWREVYLKEATRPFRIAVERENGKISVFPTLLRSNDFEDANYRYIERLVKFLLWSVGGFRVFLCGDDALASRLQKAYCEGGERTFDVGFMQDVYERPF